MRVNCDYCGQAAHFRPNSQFLYKRDYGPVYYCHGCLAWVGCHKGTRNALGRLANAELRQAKKDAHAAFDPLWQAKIKYTGCSKSRARHAGYKWLANELGIRYKDCHIGMFDVDQCRRVVEIIENHRSQRLTKTEAV